jgi:dTDP-4-amino-4,6-dideoxygalactose transaminase
MRFNTLVPLNDLSRISTADKLAFHLAFERVVKSGRFLMGVENEALESELADYLGVEHAVTVGNGTDALELALAGVGVGSGDRVVTVANAGAYASTAIFHLGARPVYCDVNPETMLMSSETLESCLAALPSAPKALVLTHLYGAMAPSEEIAAVARKNNISVVEDCAQAFGLEIQNRRVGSFGDVSTTSFFPTKNLGGLGDGGAVFTQHDWLADRIRSLRQYGWSKKYEISTSQGFNSRMDEVQAAILRLKLVRVDKQNAMRSQIHREYEEALGFEVSGLVRFANSIQEIFVPHLTVLRCANRNLVAQFFEERNIATEVHYPVPDYRQTLPFSEPQVALPVTESLASEVLSIPNFSGMSRDEMESVRRALSDLKVKV